MQEKGHSESCVCAHSVHLGEGAGRESDAGRWGMQKSLVFLLGSFGGLRLEGV